MDRAHGPGARGRRRRGRGQRRPDDLRPLSQPRPGGARPGRGRGRRQRRGRGLRPASRTAPRSGSHDGEVIAGDDAGRVGARASTAEVVRSEMGRRAQRPAPPSSRASPTTAPSSCGASRTCCCTATASRGPPPSWPVARSSWSSRSHDWEAELRGIRAFIREQDPVLIGVDAAPTRWPTPGTGRDCRAWPARRRRAARGRGAAQGQGRHRARRARGAAQRDRALRAHRHAARCASRPTATTEDAALILASTHEAALIVGVGMHATLDEFLDRRRTGLASTFLTRLKVGPELVDAAAVPQLYDGAVRPRHLLGAARRRRARRRPPPSASPRRPAVGRRRLPVVTEHHHDLIDNVQGLLP